VDGSCDGAAEHARRVDPERRHSVTSLTCCGATGAIARASVAPRHIEVTTRSVHHRFLHIGGHSHSAALLERGSAHVEIDISRQVILLVNDEGVVTNVLSTSTGNGARYFSEGKWETAYTPRGTFKIQRQIKGIRKAALGTIYYPSYFNGGIAIHGSNSIPTTAASHGCARIPRFADKDFANMVTVGMPVYVYD